MKRIIAFFLWLLLLGGAFLAYDIHRFLTTPGSDTPRELVITIAPGATFDRAAWDLKKAGAITDVTRFRLLARYKDALGKIRVGDFLINTGWTPEQVLWQITQGQPVLYRLSVREGLTWWETARELEAQGFARYEDFKEVIHDPDFLREHNIPFANAEGFLYPETYLRQRPRALDKSQAREVASSMISMFWKRTRPLWTQLPRKKDASAARPANGAAPNREAAPVPGAGNGTNGVSAPLAPMAGGMDSPGNSRREKISPTGIPAAAAPSAPEHSAGDSPLPLAPPPGQPPRPANATGSLVGNATAQPGMNGTLNGNATAQPSGNATAQPSGNATGALIGNATAQPVGGMAEPLNGNATAQPSGNATGQPTGNSTAQPSGGMNGTLAGGAAPAARTEERTAPLNPEDLDPEALRRMLILASLVEKETSIPKERARVAGVYANRMRLGMLLQCDPTIIYGVGESFTGSIRKSQLNDAKNVYNTYIHAGLPPGPICSPGLEALKAAAAPELHDFLYFVATGVDGGHNFSKTLNDHNKAVQVYRSKVREGQ